jgi:two-component system, NarL family, response regulator LiaR
MHEPIKVLLVDDHAMVRRGLGAFLSIYPDLQLVGEAESGAEALEQCARFQPDVVLMDLVMPEVDGATATAELRRQFPHVKVIALTSFREDELVQRVIQAGAIGYLLKNVSGADLAQAIRAAHAGRPTLAPEATQALINAATRPAAPGHDLTTRERDVLALMVKGLNNSEIAERLIVSPSTIKGHVSNILAKLAVTSRTEAVALAVTHRIQG